ncbi:MAG TPA: PadR family transcriptional regulator [Lactobacillus sp.]|nr:PadR family transcriptional regulator [Lactobacillus sp.]
MYELFVLGQLMDKPMSGYKLKDILQRMVGEQRQISFGTIYPLLDKLAKKSFIEISIVDDDLKRTKKMAKITAAGRQRFLTLMAKPVPLNGNTAFSYDVKFHNLHQVRPALQTEILQAYKSHLQESLATAKSAVAYMRTTEIADIDFIDARRVVKLSEMQDEAALKWANETLKELEND